MSYLNIKGEQRDLEVISEDLSHPRRRVLGLVVRMVDEIMHGSQLGMAGMHTQVRQWAMTGFMQQLVDLLKSRDYDIYLTADHGNIEAAGCGRPNEGAIAETRGLRVRVYSDERLRAQVQKAFPESLPWPPIGLPDAYLPLFAPYRLAFTREHERIVSHGGSAFEELVVPFIHLK